MNGEDDAARNPLTELYAGLSTLLRDEEWASDLAAKLKTGAMSPLDFAVFCQADASTVRHLYELDPEQLTTSTLSIACDYGSKPGVIPFMAQTKPEIVSFEECSYEYPISLAMCEGPGEGRPSEDDIKSMVEAYPAGVAKTMFWHEDEGPGKWTTPLQQCVTLGYSDELCEFMCSRLPNTIQDFEIADDYGNRGSIGWIATILERVRGKLDLCALNWDGNAFVSFVEILLQNTSMQALDLQLPSHFRSREGTEEERADLKALSMLPMVSKLATSESLPGVQELSLSFSELPNSHLAYFSLLDGLSKWPRLRSLKVELRGHLDVAAPAIGRLLEESKLEDLHITVSASSVVRSDDKCTQDDQIPLKPVFDGLRRNSTLKRLEVRGVSEKESIVQDRLLLDALKSNTTLHQARGFHISRTANRDGHDELSYYLYLNHCGRCQAQNPQTTVGEFVDLLVAVERKLAGGRQYASNVQYGLLLEAVGIWARS